MFFSVRETHPMAQHFPLGRLLQHHPNTAYIHVFNVVRVSVVQLIRPYVPQGVSWRPRQVGHTHTTFLMKASPLDYAVSQ